MPSRCVLIVLDGLGDRSYAVLDHKTPLEAASSPSLDALAERGASGLLHADTVGVALSSQDAHFALYGYDRGEIPKRGILEAVGAGMKIGPGDVAVLARLVSACDEDGALKILDRRPAAPPEVITSLMAEVDTYETRGIRFHYTQINKLEGILVLSGDVSPAITDTDPLKNGLPMPEVKPLRAAAGDPAAENTARAFKEYLVWVYRSLSAHPINSERVQRGARPLNAFITHLADRPRSLQPFTERWGLKGLSITPKLVQWGVGETLGMKVIKVADTTDPGRDIADRIAIARDNCREYDFIHVHSMAPDRAAHTKDPLAKKHTIEALDRGIGEAIGALLQNPDLLLIVTADHCTPSSGPLIHSGETVPIVMIGEGVRRDRVSRFSEVDCASGSLGVIRGREFMPLVLSQLDRCKLRGIMHSPDDQAFWPGNYEPFRLDE